VEDIRHTLQKSVKSGLIMLLFFGNSLFDFSEKNLNLSFENGYFSHFDEIFICAQKFTMKRYNS